ncbi:MAG: hypothetical protein ACYCTF_02005, partial [Acidiferrobacter sp.]
MKGILKHRHPRVQQSFLGGPDNRPAPNSKLQLTQDGLADYLRKKEDKSLFLLVGARGFEPPTT